jgi:Tol biopolymer transport system component
MLLGMALAVVGCTKLTTPSAIPSATSTGTPSSAPPPTISGPALTKEPDQVGARVPADGDSGSSGIAVSADGRYLAFASTATNLVDDDTNLCDDGGSGIPGSCSDIFLHDVTIGRTRRISVGHAGEQANGPSWEPAISADGRFVAFRSSASSLDGKFAGACAQREYPDNCHGIFVVDTSTGALDLVHVLSDNGGIGFNEELEISPDGRYLVFDALGEHMPLPGHPQDDNFALLTADRLSGEMRIAEDEDRRRFQLDERANRVTKDGLRILESEEALVPDDTRLCDHVQRGTHNCADIYLQDMGTGSAERIVMGFDGQEPDGDSYAPSISKDGRFVAFSSEASNLIPELAERCADEPQHPACRVQVYLLDRETGEIKLISRNRTGEPASGASVSPIIASDGSRVVFASFAPDIVAGDRVGEGDPDLDSNRDVFVYDRVTDSIGLVSFARIDP